MYNNKAYEKVHIRNYNEKEVFVTIKQVLKKIDKKERITRYIDEYIDKSFIVTNGEIDIKYIEKLFDSFNEERRK